MFQTKSILNLATWHFAYKGTKHTPHFPGHFPGIFFAIPLPISSVP